MFMCEKMVHFLSWTETPKFMFVFSQWGLVFRMLAEGSRHIMHNGVVVFYLKLAKFVTIELHLFLLVQRPSIYFEPSTTVARS